MESRTGRLHSGRYDHGKWRETTGTQTSGDGNIGLLENQEVIRGKL